MTPPRLKQQLGGWLNGLICAPMAPRRSGCHLRRPLTVLVVAAFLATGSVAMPRSVAAFSFPKFPKRSQTGPLRPRTACPTQIEPLTQALLRDLPSYTNRQITRQTRRADFATMSQVVAASAPEFEPLPLSTSGSANGSANGSATASDPNLKQIFFTTLERQTTGGQLVELQQHHWLFLTPTKTYGWRLAMLYTRLGSYPAGRVITPPRESSQGPIGQAIGLWLRDCQAGAIAGSGPPLTK
jgi:hypothetical protein